jgi:hypothetical protein
MLKNLSPFAADIIPSTDVQGKAIQLLVVKATLDFQGHVIEPGKREGIHTADVDWGDIGFKQALRHESDWVAFKPWTDVIVNCSAYAPRGQAVHEFDAAVLINAHLRQLRIFGKRQWRSKLGITSGIELMEPVSKVPLVYPLAYGGTDSADSSQFFPSNPMGLGFTNKLAAHEVLLPQIEWMDKLIHQASDRPEPAGTGCIGRTWQPRLQWLGTYTEAELKESTLPTKMPASFNLRAWNCAHPRLQFPHGEVTLGSTIALKNLSESGQASAIIPMHRIKIEVMWRGSERILYPHFDTVILEPDHDRMILVWRQAMQLQAQDIAKIHIHVHD